MKIEQIEYFDKTFHGNPNPDLSAQWVLVFGSKALISDRTIIGQIRERYPNAYLMGCSTAGEIHDNAAKENSLSITAIELEQSKIKFGSHSLEYMDSSFETGRDIISELDQNDLRHVFVLCEGVNINGSQLVEGMRTVIKPGIPITGGLAGDGTNFSGTVLLDNDCVAPNRIVLAAICGNMKSSCASYGGWGTFGIERLVTKSRENILYEIDGKPALDLYKEYLGEKSSELPSSALLFPLSVRIQETNQSFVRTILSVNEEDKSMIFAGDIPMNSYCKLMKSNFNNLVGGSLQAAELAKNQMGTEKVDLAILISCVGRKLVLKQRVDDEIEVVREIVGENTAITGFYSYGEIAPHRRDTPCELHNQTMTVTLLTEG